jgi:ADP-ribose pyrophosphatase
MLPPRYQDSPCVLKGPRFDVHRVTLEGSDESKVERDVVAHGGSVMIVPVLDDDRIVLIRNYRISFDQVLWELPAGTLEAGEDPADCANREVIEETGYKAGRLVPMLELLPAPGLATERMHTFVAYDLSHVGQQLDAVEQITVEVLNWDKIMGLLSRGEIQDAKTIAGLLYYRQFIQNTK